MENHQKRYEPAFFFAIFLVCIGLCLPGEIYGQTSLINPHLPNSYLDSYVLPDSTVRIIGSEHGGNRGLFYVDKLSTGVIKDPVFFPESIGELEFNFAGVDCKVLPLKSGDILLGINQADCDYAPYSSLAKFTIEGEVVWAISMESFNFNYFIHKLTRVDSNVFCLISEGLDTLYVDGEGNEVAENLSFVVYDTVIAAPIGYYAALDSNLFHLDERFDAIDSVELDHGILAFSLSGDSLITVSTTSSLVILDTNLEVIVQTTVFGNLDLVTTSLDWIWISQRGGGDIIQLDYLLQPQDTFPIHGSFQLKSMVAINEIITLGGNYLSVTGASVFFHSTVADQYSFMVEKDIALQSVRIEEPIFYSFEPFAIPWGFNIPYQDVSVIVSNTGQDTIQALTIIYNAGSGCGFCHGEFLQWSFDSLNLYPGLQRDIALGDFSVWCVTQTPTKFCLSILPADSLPESDNLNNKLCIEVDAFLTGVNEAEPSFWSLSPNPANEFITIDIEEANVGDYHGMIINGNGDQVERFILQGGKTQFSLIDYPPGIYILSIQNSQGVYLVKKLSVIH